MNCSDNPLCVAWLMLNGAIAEKADLRFIATALAHNRRFNSDTVGLNLFVQCVEEIKNDPDTYSKELQEWAAYQLADAIDRIRVTHT